MIGCVGVHSSDNSQPSLKLVTLLWHTLEFWATLDQSPYKGDPIVRNLIRNHPSVAQNLSVHQSSVTVAKPDLT